MDDYTQVTGLNGHTYFLNTAKAHVVEILRDGTAKLYYPSLVIHVPQDGNDLSFFKKKAKTTVKGGKAKVR
jgi:hypothetical protein